MKGKNIIIILLLLVTGCRNSNDSTGKPVEGMYVTHFKTEYNEGMDTIRVIPINQEAGTYRYIRSMGYRRISGETRGPYQYKVENSTGVFNRNTLQLSEERYGRTYSFSEDGDHLFSGEVLYKRIGNK